MKNVFVLIALFLPQLSSANSSANAAANSSIDGKWILAARKCKTAADWEPLDRAVTYLNSATSSYELEVASPSCTLRKIGKLEVKDSTITFCDVKASATGAKCDAFNAHVKLVNAPSRNDVCSSRPFEVTDEGQTLLFSEASNEEGFACPIGVDVEYKMVKEN